LSFPLAEGEQTPLPSGVLRLGDIVLSYPQVIKESARDDMMVDDKINELVQHGLLHLLGEHHSLVISSNREKSCLAPQDRMTSIKDYGFLSQISPTTNK